MIRFLTRPLVPLYGSPSLPVTVAWRNDEFARTPVKRSRP